MAKRRDIVRVKDLRQHLERQQVGLQVLAQSIAADLEQVGQFFARIHARLDKLEGAAATIADDPFGAVDAD